MGVLRWWNLWFSLGKLETLRQSEGPAASGIKGFSCPPYCPNGQMDTATLSDEFTNRN